MSILNALKAQEGSIRELAMLPQQQILKMAQMGQLSVSLVPIVLNEKAQMAQQAANMQAMAQQVPPTVVEQAMAMNAQAETPQPAGIETLPQGTEMFDETSLAGGGIVAFADGGEADDDEEEDDDSFDSKMDRENEALLQQLASMRTPSAAGVGALGSGLRSSVPIGSPELAKVAPAGEARGSGLRAPSGHKYAKEIAEQAERMGIDPDYALKIAMKETGGLKNPESARSRAGALGVMQLMPGTAKDMGVEDPLDPQQNISGGLRYAKMMLNKYQDPKIAAIAYNWGPGNTDKWLRAGADMSKLPKETRDYVANLKEGGVARFQNQGMVEGDYEGFFPFLGRAFDDSELRKLMRFAGKAGMDSEIFRYGKPLLFGGKPTPTTKGEAKEALSTLTTTPAAAEKAAKAARKDITAEERDLQSQYEAQDIQEGDLGRLQTPATDAIAAAAQAATGEGAPAAPASMADKLEALLARREKNLEAQRQQDKYMALLTAGLGIMGGSSPYAMQNIGAGALQGAAALQAANKQRAAEENAILSGRVGQARLSQNEALRREIADRGQEAKFTQQLSIAKNNMLKNVAAAMKMDLSSITDPNLLAKIESQADAMLARDPAYQAMFKKLYGTEFKPTQAAASAVDYNKKYGLNPRKQ